MGRILSYTLVACLCLYQTSVHATLYRGDIFGTVQTLSDAVPVEAKTSPFNIGDPFQFTFLVDTNQPLSPTASLNIGGFLGTYNSFFLNMWESPTFLFSIGTNLESPSNIFNGLVSDIGINVEAPAPGVGLEQSFSFSDLAITSQSITMDANAGQYIAGLTMTGGSYGLAAVPIPPAILLFASGLLTLWRPRIKHRLWT